MRTPKLDELDRVANAFSSMLRRMLLGVLKGILIGGLVGGLWVFGLGTPLVAGFLGYVAAILTGVCAALVAGKPIWARGAWIEVLLKSVAAAVLGFGVMYGVRNWLDTTLSAGPLGQGLLSELPLVMLPLVATVLAVFFEIDNTDEATNASDADGTQRRRVAADSESSHSIEAELESEGVDERRANNKLQ